MKSKASISGKDDFENVIFELEKTIAENADTHLEIDGRAIISTELYEAARIAGQSYRKGCGMASRKKLDEEKRREVRNLLFRARNILDSRIETTILGFINQGSMPIERLLKRQVFGFCKKQGVSFRLSLSTCVPSRLCGGGCYAHDGRERVTSTILSGCYNTLIAKLWETKVLNDDQLLPHIFRAVKLALEDASFAKKEYGIDRRARIRLAHVGELTAYPKFANWIGRSIREVSDGSVDGIIYTRHPKIVELDTDALIINLTIDESSENRREWIRKGVRPVWSAWKGKLDTNSEVNFLEHHDHGQHYEPQGDGSVCPVTSAKTEERFCDAFHCTKCFDDPNAVSNKTVLKESQHEERPFRTRRQGMLQASESSVND
jgi:hypothetical protein